MAGDWFKMFGDVVDALGVGDEGRRSGGLGAYLRGRSTQTGDDGQSAQPYVYERWLTRPRDPKVNDR